MKNISSRKVSAFLPTDDPHLQFILTKIKTLDTLNRRMTAYLDSSIQPYCQVANMDRNRLTIIAANGSIATQLRFQIPDLLNQFKQDSLLQKIQTIHCKVLPSLTPLQPSSLPAKKLTSLSLKTAAIIREMAETIEDPTLRAVMEKIARHTNKL